MKIWDLASYKKPVEIDSPRSLAECENALGRITRPPFTFGRDVKARPFVGQICGARGKMWFFRRAGLSMSARTLSFSLNPNEGGCRLIGELAVTAPLRWFTGLYLIFCIVMSVVFVIGSISHAQKISWLYELWLLLRGVGFGFLFMYGYNGFCVLVGRHAEQRGLKLIKHLMASETAEAVVVDLLG